MSALLKRAKQLESDMHISQKKYLFEIAHSEQECENILNKYDNDENMDTFITIFVLR